MESKLKIKEQDFPKVLEHGVVVADFFADWCMPCVMMGEVIENLSDKYSEVKFVKVNIEEAQSLSQNLEISSIPCVVLFQNGKEVDRIVGNVDNEFLEEKIKSYLK